MDSTINRNVIIPNHAVSFGRTMITTSKRVIDKTNVVEVLSESLLTHSKNQAEIQNLYNYYVGEQESLHREKSIRGEINNKVVENRANEIVSFWEGYIMGEPIQYVSRDGEQTISDKISQLNSYMDMCDKHTEDINLAEDELICGCGYRMVLPRRNDYDDAPFKIYTLDPRYTFVVYSNGIDKEPLMGVIISTNEDNDTLYTVYTKNEFFEIVNKEIVKESSHILGQVPIIEYVRDKFRIGSFEVVRTLLDAINEVESNRVDGIEQFVQSYLMLKGVDIEEDDFERLKDLGGIVVPPDGDARYITQELNQTQTQVLVDHLYQTILTICGMPNRNGGLSTSDTGAAVTMRDGWSDAESRAKKFERMFRKSERRFLSLVLRIVNISDMDGLKLVDIDIRFTRRNYENIQSKAQVLTTLLGNPKVHPRLAFEHSGMFLDANLAYEQSMQYYKEEQKRLEEVVKKGMNDESTRRENIEET